MPVSTKPVAGAIGTHNSANIIAVVGATGMGKGAMLKLEILPRRTGPAVVWSPLEETDKYAAIIRCKRVTALPAVIDEWRAGRSVVYEPPLNPKLIAPRFDLFCRAAWHMSGTLVIIEELVRVTKPSWAPTSWKNLTTAGRHRGVTLIGTCQRPAQVDKDFFGNCSEVRCFRVNFEDDAKVMANVLRVDMGTVLELEKLHYIRRVLDERRNALYVVGGGMVADLSAPTAGIAGNGDRTPTHVPKQNKSQPRKRKNAAKRR